MSTTTGKLTDTLTPTQGGDRRALLARLLREKAGGSKSFPPSHAQQRLWFLDQMEPGSARYNVPSAVSLSGRLDASALAGALREIVRRHEVLRTRFTSADGRPVQVVERGVELEVPTVDLTTVPEAEREARAKQLAREEAGRPFDLSCAPLVRATLLRLSDEEHVLLLTMHHIVSDGWSTGVLVRELRTLYAAYAAGQHSPLEELPVQYADYAVWQRGWLEGGELDRQLSYWREKMAGAPEVLEIAGDRARPAAPSNEGALESVLLPDSLAEGLRELARREGVTLYMLLLAAWQTLLMRYTGQEDVVVGSPVAGRTRAETEGLIGFFVNTLVLRTDLSGDPTFRELLGRVREVCLGAYAHQEVPFEKVVEELAPERSLSRNPLFQVIFSLQNAPGGAEGPELPGLRMRSAAVDNFTSVFDLTLMMQEGARGLSALVQYSTDLYSLAWVERMMRHFRALLEGVVANPRCRLSEVELLSAEEQRLIEEWNATRAELPSACVHELFERHAASNPEAVALISDGVQMSYGELNEKANRLARLLRQRGVGAESRVGLLMERGTEAVVSLLAILKAGGAYVPLDPEYPQERLRFMLEDSDVRLVLTNEGLGSLLDGVEGVEVVDLGAAGDELARESGADLECVTNHDSAAYVMYTSGSTGRPKGVLVEHRAVVRLVCDTDYVTLAPGDTVAQLATVSFDASTFELWGALACGARLAVIPKEVALSPEGLAQELRRQRVSSIFMTTALFNQLAREAPGALRGVREVLFGGEAVDPRAVREVLRGGGPERLLHVYGPTENTTFSTWERVREVEAGARTVSIGRPIRNAEAYVLDRRMRLVPFGAPGELYVGGPGLARYYVGRAALTAEKFVPHPFSGEPGARLYRTGDVARLLSDGRIEFVGRADNQVKVRGYRIELGEVEAALNSHETVGQCVVVVREDEPGDKRLVAYVVAAGAEVSASELREHLKAGLPEYMVPSAFVLLDELPLTLNGKVDRKALPVPDSSAASSAEDYVAPRDPVEEVIAGVWAEVLRVERVGVRDNFFDLGGHSLLATQVVSRVRQLLQVELPLRSLFEGPTVEALAEQVRRGGTVYEGALPPAVLRASREGDLPASYAQQRLWLVEQLEPGAAAYNIPSAARLRGRLDAEALCEALREIVRRHESLRTRFTSADGRPVQVIEPGVEFDVPVVDLTGMSEAEREERAKGLAREEARRPFDLTRAPLMRAALLRLSDEEHVLLLTLHHIVSDGWSTGVLVRELRALYEAFAAGQESPLEELPIQYADYAVWQRGWLEGGELDRQLSYWRGQLSGAPEVLEVAGDRARPSAPSYEGALESVSLSAELSSQLRELARREGVTLYMLLLAAWQTFLMRYTGQEDVVVGSPVAGRTRAETEGLIGFFVNTLVLRTDLSGDPTFRELLKRVREVCLGAYAHQEVPFEKVVEELAPERSLSRNPLFQIEFILQNAPREALELSGVSLSPFRTFGATAQFDLTLGMSDDGGEIGGTIGYSTDLYDAATIRQMLGHFRTLLGGIASDPRRRLSSLPLLEEAERQRLLVSWNDTARAYPRDSRAHELFEQQARRTPEAIAASDEDGEISYAELNARANRLARALVARGVGADSIVGLVSERGIGFLTAMLAVFKAGGAYLPLDPRYPAGRLLQVVGQSRTRLLLTSGEFFESMRELAGQLGEGERPEVFALESLVEAERVEENLPARGRPGDLAYVIYTSGSTGVPKGAMVEHRGMVNHLCAKVNDLRMSEGDVVAQTASQCFDISVWQFLSPLLVGGRVHIFNDEVARDPRLLLAEVAARGVTILETVPSLLSVMTTGESGEGLGSLRWMIATGEALPPALCRQWLGRHPNVPLLNAYGPTECSDDVTHHVIRQTPEAEAMRVPIGRPVANTRLYVLDGRLSPAPAGVAGELYVGGDGVGRGYFGDPGRTAASFIPDPFAHEPGARLYRTGDLARWLTDGELEFIGRIDYQVKVRGFRIELGEIEAVLGRHPSVCAAVVLVREDAHAQSRLTAYAVAEQGSELSEEELRGFLKERLPDYMVPSAFVVLDELPLTANGKVDRKALPEPVWAGDDTAGGYVEPRNSLEEVLADIWAEVLDLEHVGVHDNFFEIGGHSLLAMMVTSRVLETLQVELPLRLMFEEPTVAGLAAALATDPEVGEDALRAAALLARLSSLSEAEVDDMLSGRAAAAEGF
jgi:amino acid adenylation domain-containing protein